MKKLIALFIIGLISGCQNYSFSLNDNELYTPRSLFKQYVIIDSSLAACVQQAILDQNVRDASELHQLSCSYAGVKQLDGIEVFYKLESLNLAHNNLSDISRLMQLSDLKILNLSHNALSHAQQLTDLPHLQQLKLKANAGLACNFDSAPASLNISLPEHCLGH